MQSGFISLSLSGSIQISIISWHLRPLSLSQSDWDRYQQATSIVMTASIFRWRSEIASSYAYLRDRSKWREPKRSSSLSNWEPHFMVTYSSSASTLYRWKWRRTSWVSTQSKLSQPPKDPISTSLATGENEKIHAGELLESALRALCCTFPQE